MHFINTIQLSLKSWFKTPVVAVLAVLILGIGIGASVAAYGFLNAALLQPLAVKNPDELMRVASLGRTGNMTAGHYYDMIKHSPVLSESFFSRLQEGINLQSGDSAALVTAGEVSGNYFEALGVPATRGRMFTRDDDRSGASPVVIISERLWRDRFNASENLVGSLVALNGRPMSVVGIAPRAFTGTARMTDVDVWYPHQQTFVDWQLRHRSISWYPVMIRLRDDSDVPRIEADLQSFIATFADEITQWFGENYTLVLRPEREVAMVSDRALFTQSLFILAVLLALLLISCAVVSNLLLAKVSGRRSELAMRRALGAPSRSIFGLLLVDGMVITVLGGLAGILLAVVFVRGFSLLGMEMPAGSALDVRVLVFFASLTLLVGFLCGLFPAIQAVRTNINEVLKESSRTSTNFRAGGVLIIMQVAFSLALLIAGGLFVRSLQEAQRVEPGIRMDNVLSFTLNLDNIGEFDRDERIAFHRRILERLDGEPEIASVGISQHRLLQGTFGTGVWVSGVDFPDDSELWGAHHLRLGPGFLETMDIELLRGRVPTLEDARMIADRRGVAVINETMAERFWPGQDPVGREFRPWGGRDSPWIYQVIGVCRDFRVSLRTPPRPLFAYGDAESDFVVVAHTRIPPESMKPKFLQIMRDFEPGLPVQELRTIEESRNQSIQSIRTGFMITLVIGLLGLAISAVGIYAALGNWIERSRKEIGLRMALGASVGAVVGMYVRRGCLIVLSGLAVGLLLAALVIPRASDLYFGVSPWDPATFLLAPAILFAAAFVSCAASARRAAHLHPMNALRAE